MSKHDRETNRNRPSPEDLAQKANRPIILRITPVHNAPGNGIPGRYPKRRKKRGI